jgi:hypothetical protein
VTIVVAAAVNAKVNGSQAARAGSGSVARPMSAIS